MDKATLLISPVEPTSRDSGMLIPASELVETLGSRGRVDLVTFADVAEEEEEYGTWGRIIRLPRRSRGGYYASLRGWGKVEAGGVPRAVYPYAGERARSVVASVTEEARYSGILCYLGHVAQLVPPELDVSRFLVVQDVLHNVIRLNVRYQHGWARRIASRREIGRMREYERYWYGQFDGCSVVSHAEAARLKALVGNRSQVHVIPNGVAVGADAPDPDNQAPARRRLVYIGSLEGQRNVEGVQWLLSQVLPLIRREVDDVAVDIVGRAPPPELVELAGQLDGVELTGRVPNTAEYLRDDAIFVSTNRVGSGIRNGVLEAMASGVPCVATSPSLEGLEGTPGENYIVCDERDAFASEVIRLVRNPRFAAQLGRSGQELVRRGYSWSAYRGQILAMMGLA